MNTIRPIWKCKDRRISLEEPLIMGIVNVTPDSFSDGGRFFDASSAIEHGLRLLEEGADILDIGGESTRPGAREVSVEDELNRVVPVIEALAREGATVSVDTSKAEIMRAASQAGALIINDVYALRREGALQAAAESGCGVCLMHMQGEPRTMQDAPRYDDLMAEVAFFLRERKAAAVAAGIPEESVVADPGIGFGKTVGQNYELIAQAARLTHIAPLLYGISRKSLLGAVTGVREPAARTTASLAANIMAVERGVSIVRVHDVKAMKEALEVYRAVKEFQTIN